jgi:hypothetical protein
VISKEAIKYFYIYLHKKVVKYCETISAYTKSTDLIFNFLKNYSCCDTIPLRKVAEMGGKNGIEMEWIRAKALSGNVYWKGRKRCSREGRRD